MTRDMLQLIDGDFGGLFLLAVILAWLGGYPYRSHPSVQTWAPRLSFVAFVLYVVSRISRDGISDAFNLAGATCRGLLVGLLTFGVTACLLAFANVLCQLTLAPVSRRISAAAAQLKHSQCEAKERCEEEAARCRADEEWARTAPQRERLQQQQEEARLQEFSERERRENACFQSQLLYDSLTPDQKQRLPYEHFQAYLEQYLSDEKAADEVERRAQQLQAMIRELMEPTGRSDKPFSSIGNIAEHFQERRVEIDALGYDQKAKEALLALLSKEEQSAIRRFLSP